MIAISCHLLIISLTGQNYPYFLLSIISNTMANWLINSEGKTGQHTSPCFTPWEQLYILKFSTMSNSTPHISIILLTYLYNLPLLSFSFLKNRLTQFIFSILNERPSENLSRPRNFLCKITCFWIIAISVNVWSAVE